MTRNVSGEKSRASISRSAAPAVELSVIVCSFNGAERIADCLKALAGQTARDRIEVIVVDDGSRDITTIVATAALEVTEVRHRIVTLSENVGLSAARNAGVVAASAPIIAFTDDDCVPGPTWAEALLTAWSKATSLVHGIGGPVAAHSTDTYNRRFLDAAEPLRVIESGGMRRSAIGRVRNYLAPRRTTGRRNVDSFVGANMSFRRSTIDAVGGFDDAIRFGGDELYLCRAITDAFGPEALIVEPSLVMAHEFHGDVADTIRRAKAYGRGNGRNWANSGGFPSLLPGPSFALLATLLGFVVSPVVAVAAFLVVVNLLGRAPLTRSGGGRSISLFELLSYPYLVLYTELMDNIGFVRGALDARRGSGPVVEVAATSSRTAPVSSDAPVERSIHQWLNGWSWLAVGVLASVIDTGWPTRLLVLGTLVLLPGSVLLQMIGFRPRDLAGRVLAATGIGVTCLMAVGLVSSWVGPRIGVDRPFDRVPASLITLVFIVSLLVAAGHARNPWTWLRGEEPALSARWFALLATPPVVAALFAMRLNNGGTGAPAYVLIALLALIIIVTMFRTWSDDHGWPVGGIVASVSLALAWSTTLRGHGLFGWDIQKELGIGLWTIAHGSWAIPSNGDAYASMLSLTVLPAQFHAIAGVSVQSTLRWVFPVVLAITAAGVLSAARRRANAGPALLALIIVVIGTPSFARQIPAIGRQEIAFLLFTTILLAITEHELSLRARRNVALLAGIGLSFSHYTSAYVTSFFLFVVLVISALLRDRGRSRQRVLSLGVCVAIIGSTFLWNGVLTRPGTELTEAQATLSTTGIRFLDNEESNPLKVWLGGTGVRLSPFEKYRDAVVERRDRLDWVIPDPRSTDAVVTDASAPVLTGAFPQLKTLWYLGTLLLRQIVTLLTVLSLFWYLRRVLRRHPEFDTELFALGAGAFLIAALLRLSSTAAQLYNPERAAIHAGLVFTLILATFFSRHLKRISVPTGMAVLLVIGAWGLSVPAFGGAPLAAYSNIGEDVERYVTSATDAGTANWIATSLPQSANVHADRYGRVVLLSHEFDDNFTVIDVVDPLGVDKHGYVFFTSMNRGSDRARGQVDDLFSVFTSPEAFFEQTRSVVYATEETRVYR